MNKWYSSQGSNSDVVLASKVRLIRNLADAPFPHKLTAEGRKSVCKKIFASVKNSDFAGEYEMTALPSLSVEEKLSLAERGVISSRLADSDRYSAVITSHDESVSIMLCEEDHIRLTSVSVGQSLEQAYKKADELDDVFIGSLNIAFSDKLGFLTANPMNLGTGLKASLVLHLPAIYEKGMTGSLRNMLGKLGFDLTPLYTKGSALYELSNRITLGITEKSALDNLNAICDQIVRQERGFRQELMAYDGFEDKIFRAMGTLKMARRLSTGEFYELISLVRMGVAMGSFDISYELIGEMLHSLGTATIMSQSDEGMTEEEADRYRAQYVREKFE
jgi:protein arginine kinase